MSIRLCTLSSGSNANSVYVEAGDARILVDAGLTGVEVRRRLESVGGCEPGDLDAILVTHEHRDHVSGVGVLARRHGVPVYANDGTARAMDGTLGPRVELRRFSTGRPFGIGAAAVMPFPISHDAAEPVGYIISAGGRKAVVATDMGQLHPMTRGRFVDAELMVFEANHDPDMLASGPYPEFLKRRIRSSLGHLSNSESGAHLGKMIGDNTRGVLLAHLSENNNTPDVALGTVRGELEEAGLSGFDIGVAPRYEPSGWLETD